MARSVPQRASGISDGRRIQSDFRPLAVVCPSPPISLGAKRTMARSQGSRVKLGRRRPSTSARKIPERSKARPRKGSCPVNRWSLSQKALRRPSTISGQLPCNVQPGEPPEELEGCPPSKNVIGSHGRSPMGPPSKIRTSDSLPTAPSLSPPEMPSERSQRQPKSGMHGKREARPKSPHAVDAIVTSTIPQQRAGRRHDGTERSASRGSARPGVHRK